jgi:hypothetical protein
MKVETGEQLEARFGRNEARRFASDQRAWDQLGRQLADADALIGELNGGTFYINVRSKGGRLTGAIRRFATRSDAQSFLIRNRYV